MPQDVVYVLQGVTLFPLGRWAEGRLIVFDQVRLAPHSACPDELIESSCGAYRAGPRADQYWQDLLAVRDVPVYVNGRRIGQWSAPEGFVSDPSIIARDTRYLDWAQIARSSGPRDLEFNYAIATPAAVSPAPGWEPSEMTEAHANELRDRVRSFIERTYGRAAHERLGPIVHMGFTAFRAGERRVEFASMTFEAVEEDAGYAISLAWGLSGTDSPVVFHPLQQVGTEGYPLFFHVIQVMDLGKDGTVEVLLRWTDNYSSAFELWQIAGTQPRRVGLVWRE